MNFTYEEFSQEVFNWKKSPERELRILLSNPTPEYKENLIVWANSLGYEAAINPLMGRSDKELLYLHKDNKYYNPVLENQDTRLVEIKTTSSDIPEISDTIDWDSCFVSIPDAEEVNNLKSQFEEAKILDMDLDIKALRDNAVFEYVETLKKSLEIRFPQPHLRIILTEVISEINYQYGKFKLKNEQGE